MSKYRPRRKGQVAGVEEFCVRERLWKPRSAAASRRPEERTSSGAWKHLIADSRSLPGTGAYHEASNTKAAQQQRTDTVSRSQDRAVPHQPFCVHVVAHGSMCREALKLVHNLDPRSDVAECDVNC